MTKSLVPFIITSKKQLTALASPARQEIVDVLTVTGALSVAELAATLGKPADALYYHLRILAVAGLIEKDGSRQTQGKPEALFRARGSELRIDYKAARRNSSHALTAAVSSMLRLGIRDFRQAIRNQDVVVSGNRRDLWALRKTGWLSLKDMAHVNDSIAHLTDAVSRPRGRGRLYAITILLTPLNRRRPASTSKRKTA